HNPRAKQEDAERFSSTCGLTRVIRKSMVSRIIISMATAAALFMAPVGQAARSCILSNAPSQKACQSSCCANKTCCATSPKKTAHFLLFSLILALTFRTAQAGDNDSAVREGRLSIDEVTNVVLANNPVIKAAQEKWQAMKARVPQAAAWEDLRAQARSRVAGYVSIPPNAFTDQSFMLQQE